LKCPTETDTISLDLLVLIAINGPMSVNLSRTKYRPLTVKIRKHTKLPETMGIKWIIEADGWYFWISVRNILKLWSACGRL